MPRFYFYIHQGSRVVPDVEGDELPDIDAAVEECHCAAREMIAEGVRANSPSVIGYAFEIIDEAGSPLRRVEFVDSVHSDFLKLQPQAGRRSR